MRLPRLLAYRTQRRPAWLAVAAGVLLPLVLCVTAAPYVLWSSRLQHEQRAELTTQNLAAAIERGISTEIEKTGVVLGAIVFELESQLAAGEIDSRHVQHQLEGQTTLRPELHGVWVTDAGGRAVLSAGLDTRGAIDFADHAWFQVQRDRADAGLYMSKPSRSGKSDEWVLSFSRRYRRSNGDFAGVVAAAVPLAHLFKGLDSVDVGARGAVALRHADLSLFAVQAGSAITTTPAIGSKSVSPDLRWMIEIGQGAGTVRTHSASDGVERTTSYRTSTVAPLVVIVGVATEDYLAAWYAEVRTVIVFCLGAVTLCAIGTGTLLRAMARNQADRQRIELLARVFECSGEAIAVMDRDNRIVEVNPAFVRRTGYSAAEAIGTKGSSILSPSTTAEQLATIGAGLREDGFWRGELVERAKDGREFPVWMVFTTVRDADGSVSHVIGNSIEVTDLKRAEDQIRHLAHHDTLTRLPNRVQLQSRLEQALATARREGDQLAMLFIDMDRFKTINDTLGHPVGDALLVEVGRRLQSMVRASDIVARLGGDEFVLVLTGVGDAALRAASKVASKLLDVLGQPYHVAGHELHSTPSIGISLFPADGEDAGALMKSADTAMYQAKAAGRNNFQFFTQAMKQASAERLAVEGGLRNAVTRQELLLHYQPQVDLASGRVIGFEALVRWHHPDMGLVPPAKFIPVAEETGMIEAIGRWVLDEALAQVARWRRRGDGRLRVAVNVSAQQLRGDNLVEHVRSALRRHDLSGEALEIELTESTAMRDPERTAGVLRGLRTLGVALAIDDFGTGYSSMALLKQLPLSSLKLDRSFVMDIERDVNDAAISRATIQLAHSLGLAVVAEGVETQAQLQFLRALECDVAQGYLFARPMPADECEAFLRRHTAAADEQPLHA